MITDNPILLDTAADSTAIAIINLIQQPISDAERDALLKAISSMVRAGLHVALELYRLRLQHPSIN